MPPENKPDDLPTHGLTGANVRERTQRNLGQVLTDAGRYSESEKLERQVIEAGTRAYGSQNILVRNAQSDPRRPGD